MNEVLIILHGSWICYIRIINDNVIFSAKVQKCAVISAE